jgi:dipeptidyl aminopeptidase/acylaminoacyl peptidase
LDPTTRAYVPVTDEKKVEEIGKRISPVYHVTADDAPALIIHGDADQLVPIQQAELMIEKYQAVHVPCKLVVKPGAAHGWENLFDDLEHFANWFDEHLRLATKSAKDE